jgi:hypothetical protein
MRLGSETNSVVNHLFSRSVKGQPSPVAGMGVTFLHWTDRAPGTIFKVFVVGSRTVIECRADDYKRIDKNGLSEDQDYEFTTKVNGGKSYFRRENDGKWQSVKWNPEIKRWVKGGGAGLRIGHRGAYHDFSF